MYSSYQNKENKLTRRSPASKYSVYGSRRIKQSKSLIKHGIDLKISMFEVEEKIIEQEVLAVIEQNQAFDWELYYLDHEEGLTEDNYRATLEEWDSQPQQDRLTWSDDI